eukprot:3185688-Lingulodinium_polyedra.AAC.1
MQRGSNGTLPSLPPANLPRKNQNGFGQIMLPSLGDELETRKTKCTSGLLECLLDRCGQDIPAQHRSI